MENEKKRLDDVISAMYEYYATMPENWSDKRLIQIVSMNESTMTERGVEELKRAGLYNPESDYGGMLGKAVEQLLKVFGEQGHSGFSASLASSLFYKLTKGDVLSPLTTDPSEWEDRSEFFGNKQIFQNKRCFHAFATAEELSKNRAYTLEGIVWKDKDGCTYMDKNSRVEFDLPGYPPVTVVKDALLEESALKEPRLDFSDTKLDERFGEPLLLKKGRERQQILESLLQRKKEVMDPTDK